jgi:hypothetical protein
VKNGNISTDVTEDKMIKVRSRMALYQEIFVMQCSVAGLIHRIFNINVSTKASIPA